MTEHDAFIQVRVHASAYTCIDAIISTKVLCTIIVLLVGWWGILLIKITVAVPRCTYYMRT